MRKTLLGMSLGRNLLNHLWVTFPNILWFNENPIQIAIFQHN